MSTTPRLARRFLAIGGRLMINPAGKLEEAISMDAMFSLKLTSRQRAHALRVNRAISALSDQRQAEARQLVRQHGHPRPGGWIVWRGC